MVAGAIVAVVEDAAVWAVGVCEESEPVAVDALGCGDSAFGAVGEPVVSAGGAVSAVGVGVLDVGASSTVVDGLGVGSVSVEPVCAPPLLLTVTPGPTSVDDDVDPVDDVVVSVVAVVVLSVVLEPDTVDDGAVDIDDSVEVPVESAPVEPVVVSALSPVDEDESDVSADASPGDVIAAMPIPSAAARAPTRPM